MGYRIVYGSQKQKTQPESRKKLATGLLVGLCAALFILGLRFTGLGEALWQQLLPGDPDVTQAALSDMIEDIREGEGFTTAFTAFCREILHGAQLA